MAFSITFQDRVAIVTLNRPERLNALSKENFRDLGNALTDLGEDKNCGAIILTGTDRAFCAGFSLETSLEKLGQDGVPGLASHHMDDVFEECVNPMVRAVINNPKPVVTAINGMAAGGGIGVALCGDVAIAARTAQFQLTFVPKLGIVPDAGASWLISRMAGRNRALPAILLGDPVSAEQALDWGMIWEVTEPEDLMATALKAATRLANGPISFYPEIRAATELAFQQDLSAHLDHEKRVNTARCAGPDFAEGIYAFLQKRAPVFSDHKT